MNFKLTAFFLACVALVLMGSRASAQTPQELLADLGDPDYAVRCAATDALLIDDTLDLDALKQLAGLAQTPEQRHRLLRVARHHTLRHLRLERFPGEGTGSVGISYATQAQRPPAEPAILINHILPGFPATGRLRPLDRLVALNGQPLTQTDSQKKLNSLIQSFKADQSITLTIIRGDQTRDIEVRLANHAALAGMYKPLPDSPLADEYQQLWLETRDAHFANLLPEPPPAPEAAPDDTPRKAPRNALPSVP